MQKNKNTQSIHDSHFVERKNEGRKPDKNSSLRKKTRVYAQKPHAVGAMEQLETVSICTRILPQGFDSFATKIDNYLINDSLVLLIFTNFLYVN